MADSIFVAFFVFKPHGTFAGKHGTARAQLTQVRCRVLTPAAACLLRVNRSVDTNLRSRDAVNRSFHGQT